MAAPLHQQKFLHFTWFVRVALLALLLGALNPDDRRRSAFPVPPGLEKVHGASWTCVRYCPPPT